MGYFKIKLRPSDTLWTKYIRLRDKDKCFWCGQLITNIYNSGVSHYHERRIESTRHDDDNCDLMHNIPCHTEAEHEKKIKGIKGATEDGEYTKRKKNQLGEDGFNRLLVQANTYKKKDIAMDKLIIKQLLAELEG